MRRFLGLIAIAVLFQACATPPPSSSSEVEFERALKIAKQQEDAPGGDDYRRKVVRAFWTVAMECEGRSVSKYGLEMVIFLDGRGRVQRIVDNAQAPLSHCFSSNIEGRAFPPPPRGGWAIPFVVKPTR